MGLKILCSGHLIRHPVGGHSWHHLQYLLGLERLGHEVVFCEAYGWPRSCYDPERGDMVSDPAYGIAYLKRLLQRCDLDIRWCYLAEDGSAHGMAREELADICRECDLYFNLSNVNCIPEAEACRRRVLVDTDPVFTQIGTHGFRAPFSSYHARFTYGELVHRRGCAMPTAGVGWLPTRQPVVLEQWPTPASEPKAPITTVVNWAPYPDQVHRGRVYGQKDREFEPFMALPQAVDAPMAIAANAPAAVRQRLAEGGWRLVDPTKVTSDPWVYQGFLAGSRAEFCVAKHGYVTTQCGWFSDRTTAYLAMGRPAIVQDTGFSRLLPCGEGLIAWRTPKDAVAAIGCLRQDWQRHSRTARRLVEEHFAAEKVLSALLERSL